ncbi:PREDICTED: RING-H2 finger protein ATL11-like [Tarenaya hassleriana]|uniref:RING-H2 finger protein ATL11-like n=1 Tax=Tarenaya hassleriana TaxID=28532 RepID=UPI00053C0C53|nr:PREDICTED: RING-H2 finger protein ATL11-like [Tarenaya hassleriana]
MKPSGRITLSRAVSIDGRHGTTFILLLFLGIGIPVSTAQTTSGTTNPGDSEGSPNDSGFDPTMAILMIVLVSFFFFLGFFSVYIRRCLERAIDGHSVDPGNWLSMRQAAARGLDTSVIETFPTFRYSTVKTLRVGKEVLECPVCLNEFQDDETLRLLPKCCHVFHPDCIDAWLRSRATCPLCRANLIPVPGESSSLQLPVLVGESDHGSRDRSRVLGSPDARLIDSVTWTNHSMPRRSMSTGWRLAGLFGRSDSTSPPVDLERFTLRLPQEVHDQLVNSSIESKMTKSPVALPQARSSMIGYRTGSLGSEKNYFYYQRFGEDGRLDRKPFSITPPYRTGSLRSPGTDEQVRPGTPKGFLHGIIRSPLDRLILRKDDEYERSPDHLRSGDKSPV